jgi:hypothetical protein
MSLFRSLFGKRAETVDLAQPPTSTAHLRAQVFSRDYFGMKLLKPGATAMRPLAAGLVEAIVEDLGSGSRTLSWDKLRQFGKTDDELFGIARAQAAAAETGAQSQVVEDTIEVIISNGFYLSAMLLEQFRNRDPKRGVLFVPLSWHHWCVHIIGGMSVAPVVPFLHAVARQVGSMMTVTDAERLVGDVFWYKPDHVIEKIDPEALSPELASALAG